MPISTWTLSEPRRYHDQEWGPPYEGPGDHPALAARSPDPELARAGEQEERAVAGYRLSPAGG